jgi:nicotinamide mononucleotide (NMN) deamidase PncC
MKILKSHRVVMASVESCTGGMIADEMTNISGASENFWGAWVVYDNSAKTALGVPSQIIAQYDAVSRKTAESLAEKGLAQLSKVLREAASQSHSNLITLQSPWKKLAVVSTTGIAGPGGGTPERPVGLCFVGVAISDASSSSSPSLKSFQINAPAGHSRLEYKTYFQNKALELLTQCLEEAREG